MQTATQSVVRLVLELPSRLRHGLIGGGVKGIGGRGGRAPLEGDEVVPEQVVANGPPRRPEHLSPRQKRLA